MRKSPSGGGGGRTTTIGQDKARMWFRQILSGLSHLQKKGVCHHDLCMENIMVDEFDNVRIIDFGLCLRVPYHADHHPNNSSNGHYLVTNDVSANTVRGLMKAQGGSSSQGGGKWQCMAPEVASMRQETFDGFAIDLWAAGIVLFEFLIGKKPFSMPDAVDAHFRSISVEGDLAGLLLKEGVELDGQAVDLLQNMLWRDPAKRLTLAEVVDHPWVRHSVPKIPRSTPSSWDIISRSPKISCVCENGPIRHDGVDHRNDRRGRGWKRLRCRFGGWR